MTLNKPAAARQSGFPGTTNMKTELEKYEINTSQLRWISIVLLLVGGAIYVMWSGLGAVLAAIGLAGFIWCFLRR